MDFKGVCVCIYVCLCVCVFLPRLRLVGMVLKGKSIAKPRPLTKGNSSHGPKKCAFLSVAFQGNLSKKRETKTPVQVWVSLADAD